MIQVIDAGPIDTFGQKGEPGLSGLPGLKGQKGEKGMYFVLSLCLSYAFSFLIKMALSVSSGALYDSEIFQLLLKCSCAFVVIFSSSVRQLFSYRLEKDKLGSAFMAVK